MKDLPTAEFERRLFRELRNRLNTLQGENLAWRRFVRKRLGPVALRILVCLALLAFFFFVGISLEGLEETPAKAVAALAAMFWIVFRGLRLANGFLAEVKFSARSRMLLAMPAKESEVIGASWRAVRSEPFVRWIEFAVLIWIGFLMTQRQEPPPVWTVIGGAVVALFATIGVALWGILLSSFFRWRLPGQGLLGAQSMRTVIFAGFLFVIILGPNLKGVFDWAADELQFFYAQLHYIPLLGWPVRWLDPVPGQPGPAGWFAITTAVAFIPLLFTGQGLRQATAFLNRHANALLATHWRHSGTASPPQKPKKQSAAKSESKPTAPPTLSTAEPEPAASKMNLLEHYAHQWFTEDERRAMTVHLGTPFPPWTGKAIKGSIGLFLCLLLAFLIDRETGSPPANIFLTVSAFVLGVSSLFQMIGGATPSRGLIVRSLGSFRAPLFSGFPIRVGDLIKADWKVAGLRALGALPVFVTVAFGIGWHIGEGAPAGVLCAAHAITYLLIFAGTRPMFFLSTLMNAIKRPSVFQSSFWILFGAGLPLILVTFFLAGLGFVLLNGPDRFWQLPGVLAGGAVFLPVLAYLWVYRVLYDRARLTIETPAAKKAGG